MAHRAVLRPGILASFIVLPLICSFGGLWRLARAVKCVDCEGIDCFGPECEGDYCMVAVYSPKIGAKIKLGEQNIVKGCVTGNLLKESLNDECERFDEKDQEVQMCMCDDTDLCNHKILKDKSRHEKTPLVTCKCNECGHHVTTCVGEYCTYSTNKEGGDVTQGCSNRSLPLIERKGIGACMSPAMSPSFVRTKIDMDFDRETCVCAKDYCNRERPDVVESLRVECNMSVKMNALFFKVDKQLGKCRGEHCFDVSMTSHDSSFQYAAQGCMSFVEGRQKHEELNDEGCVDFKSSVINMKACFVTEKGVAEKNGGRKKEKSETGEEAKERPRHRPKEKHRRPKGRQRHKPEGEEEVKEEKEPGRMKEEKADEEEESSKKEGHANLLKEKRPPPAVGAIDGVGDDSAANGPPDNDGNTALVAVFVVIMVLILIAGVIWKFELHKKIFQARYQTVAGG